MVCREGARALFRPAMVVAGRLSQALALRLAVLGFQPARRRAGVRDILRPAHANMTQIAAGIKRPATVTFSDTTAGPVEAVALVVTLSLGEGEMLGLVGESGARANPSPVFRDHAACSMRPGRITAGNIRFSAARDITKISGGVISANLPWRGLELAMIFPESALPAPQSDPWPSATRSPMPSRPHKRMSPRMRGARPEALELLRARGKFADPEKAHGRLYPA